MSVIVLETKRLIIRTWSLKDIEAYYNINQEKEVLKFLPSSLSIEEVSNFIKQSNISHNRYGYSLWALELKSNNELIGFTGLNYTDWKANFTPAVEIGWRLGFKHWGKGYAFEAAISSLKYGFEKCDLDEIVSFTVPRNVRSIKLMEKLGMKRDFNGDFFHPKLKLTHPLSHHILYRLNSNEFVYEYK